MKKIYSVLLFIIVLSVISIFYNYHEIFFKLPQSVHKWRQSDCASIALNYYQDGRNFFTPETHNLTSDGGTSGKCCTSEVPVLYYTVAMLYKAFGYHDYLYRIFNTLLFFLGLFFLFKLLLYLLKDTFWAIALSLLFFTSPVLVYYGNNYLSNSSSLAFSIIGWYFFFRFLFEKEQKWFFLSILIFLLAASFKVTALFSVFAISGIFILDVSGIVKFDNSAKLFTKPLWFILPVLSLFLVIGSWIFYAHNYNVAHDCSYFSTTIFPIWDLDRAGIAGVLENIRKIWLDQYFHFSVLIFLLACATFMLVFFRKNNKIILVGAALIFMQTIVYVLLQFWTFKDHDYYVIDMYILPILIVIGAFDTLKKQFQKVFSSLYLKLGFLLLLLPNIFYAHQQINARYEGWMNDYPEKKDIYTITPYLRQIGVLPTDTVISIPDGSHVSLYLMNQKGWTEYSDAKFNKSQRIFYNQDSAGIQSSIDKGAKYLIVNGIEQLYYKTYLQSYCRNLAGQYNSVLIFDLRHRERNFNLPDRSAVDRYFCDAETVSADQQWFVSDSDSSLFQFAGNQSQEFAYAGKMSCKLDANSPYGMTIKLKDLKKGENFLISVWRKTTKVAKGTIIASSSPNAYYNNDYKMVERDSSGWEKIVKEFFVPAELANQELLIYLYNPESDPVYFDDFGVIRFKSVEEK